MKTVTYFFLAFLVVAVMIYGTVLMDLLPKETPTVIAALVFSAVLGFHLQTCLNMRRDDHY